MGKGYYNIHITSHIEQERPLARRIWTFQYGTVKLQSWIPKFNPYKVNSPIAHVWVSTFEHPPEYFCELIIRAIASTIDYVVTIDECTKNREMLHYVGVLVEQDLRKEKEEYIMYACLGHCSTVSNGYEQHPSLCTLCEMLVHSSSECSRGPEQPPQFPKPPSQSKIGPMLIPASGPSRGKNATSKECVQVSPRNSKSAALFATTTYMNNSTMSSTNAMIQYSTLVSNAFEMLEINNDDLQEGLLARTIFEKQSHDLDFVHLASTLPESNDITAHERVHGHIKNPLCSCF